jgi:hypothetical protein
MRRTKDDTGGEASKAMGDAMDFRANGSGKSNAA